MASIFIFSCLFYVVYSFSFCFTSLCRALCAKCVILIFELSLWLMVGRCSLSFNLREYATLSTLKLLNCLKASVSDFTISRSIFPVTRSLSKA